MNLNFLYTVTLTLKERGYFNFAFTLLCLFIIVNAKFDSSRLTLFAIRLRQMSLTLGRSNLLKR